MNSAELTQLLADYLSEDGNEFQAQVNQIIATAENAIYGDVSTPDCRTTISGTVSTSTFSTPTDFEEVDQLLIAGTELEPKATSLIREMFGTTTGTPRYYSKLRRGDSDLSVTILLGPAPSGSLAYQLDYFRSGPSILSGATWLSERLPNLLLYRCLVEAYTFLKGDKAQADQYRVLYMEELEKHKGDTLIPRDKFRGQ